MNAPKPSQAREPDCIHSGWRNGRQIRKSTQPASACWECSQGPELAAHIAAWTAWLEENPDSPEALWVASRDKYFGVQPDPTSPNSSNPPLQ